MRLVKMLPVFVIGAVLFLSACNDEDQTAEVTGTVYWAETHIFPDPIDTTKEDTLIYLNPAPNVQVYLEQDKSSDIPYLGEDLYTVTDTDGTYSFTVYLGRKYSEETGLFEDLKMCDVRLYYNWTPHGYYTLHDSSRAYIAGQISTELTGLTIKSGKSVIAPDVVVGSVIFRP